MGFLSPKPTATRPTTKQAGDAAEERALHYLQSQGMHVLVRNYRTPGRGGGEIDLIMRDREGTTVFVEVRMRKSASHGGAAASIGVGKRQRIVFAARHYLMRLAAQPACRFDVVLVAPEGVEWLQAAFDAS